MTDKTCGCLNEACGCCKGTQRSTPRRTVNRPGLSAINYRVGTHGTFLETMKAALGSATVDVRDADGKTEIKAPLKRLTTRNPSDPSVALLDGWATVADVLTFYQERIANEGYLRTATEQRSLRELARLTGYSPRHGVAASVWLALEIEKGYELKLQPYEIKAQSTPHSDEMPQTFENIEQIEARHPWNKLQPRLKQPQTIETITKGKDLNPAQPRIYVNGIGTNLKQNDVILLTVSDKPDSVHRVVEVNPDPLSDRTLVLLSQMGGRTDFGHVSYGASAIADVADLYATADIMAKFRASKQREMAQRVIRHLNNLSRQLRTAGITAEAVDHTIQMGLAAITEEREMAADEQYTRMNNWLTEMLKELTKAAKTALRSAGGEAEVTTAADVNTVNITDPLKSAMAGLTKKTSVTVRNAISLDRNMARIFDVAADVGLQVAGAFQTNLKQSLPASLANVNVAPDSPVRAYVFRAVARPFGHNAPLKSKIVETVSGGEISTTKTTSVSYDEWSATDMQDSKEDGKTLYLDAKYDGISHDSWVVVDTTGVEQHAGTVIIPAEAPLLIARIRNMKTNLSRAAYGMSGPSTMTQIADPATNDLKPWFTCPTKLSAVAGDKDESFRLIRQTAVYVQSEELELTDEPITAPICEDVLIELDGLYSGLQSGRWLIVAGERDDIKDETGKSVKGVKSAELVMLGEVAQKAKRVSSRNTKGSANKESGQMTLLPGDRTHTFIKLADKLEYSYRRDTVTIYGNVVKATHGETKKETLGNGESGQVFQSFALKQPPLTFVPAPNPTGSDSTLQVYVNEVKWHECDTLASLGPKDRKFVTKTCDDGKTAVIFGNGEKGSRLPTGTANVTSVYRSGIGKAGNVQAEQINLLATKPLGAKGVINPLPASGGSDKDSRDQVRENAPLAVMSLDRLVCLQDYADFARTFAGIGKAVAAKITDGRRQWVHVTIAGADDIPIDETSDLYSNLLQALRYCGDPYQPVALQVRELMLILISAKIRIASDYQWEPVAEDVRKKLLRTFGFDARALGQGVLSSEVTAAIQSVRGVKYVDLDVLGGIPEKKSEGGIRRLLTPQEITEAARTYMVKQASDSQVGRRLRANPADFENGAMRPAQLAYLSPLVEDTLVINQIE